MPERFQFRPFWKLTRWGLVCPVGRGGDEWHNPSVYIIVPLVGSLVFFYGRDFNRDGEVHLHGHSAGRWDGEYHQGCPACDEFVGFVVGNEVTRNGNEVTRNRTSTLLGRQFHSGARMRVTIEVLEGTVPAHMDEVFKAVSDEFLTLNPHEKVSEQRGTQ